MILRPADSERFAQIIAQQYAKIKSTDEARRQGEAANQVVELVEAAKDVTQNPLNARALLRLRGALFAIK